MSPDMQHVVQGYLHTESSEMLDRVKHIKCNSRELLMALRARSWWNDASEQARGQLVSVIADRLPNMSDFDLTVALLAWTVENFRTHTLHDAWAGAGGVIDMLFREKTLHQSVDLIIHYVEKLDRGNNRIIVATLLNLLPLRLAIIEETVYAYAACANVALSEVDNVPPNLLLFCLEEIKKRLPEES